MKKSNKTTNITSDEGSDNSFIVRRCYRGRCFSRRHALVREEPLIIRVEERPYSVVMRTPGEEIFHAAGFCLTEGIVEDADDLVSITFCPDMDHNTVDIRISPIRREQLTGLLARRIFISQTSCGVCGRMTVEEICQTLVPVIEKTKIDLDDARRAIERLPQFQRLHKKTYGSHAAMLLDSSLNILSMAEDVGRHNALDKAIGRLLMTGKLSEARVGVLSSRISYEMIQKAAMAHLPILLSASRPTALAVNLGRRLNMTLACTARESELIIFCGEGRINRKGNGKRQRSQ